MARIKKAIDKVKARAVEQPTRTARKLENSSSSNTYCSSGESICCHTMSGRRRSTAAPPKDQTCLRIERMEADREERRRAMVERKKARAAEEKRNIAAGNPGDVDFIGMVRQWRADRAADAKAHDNYDNEEPPRICICVRKRPISDKEREKNDHDSVTCLNPTVWIHCAKLKVDGITKYLDHSSFTFDHAFDESVSTEEVYRHTTMPLLDFCVAGIGGRATVFAFGQTGSGKTHTMQGIQEILVEDLFLLLGEEGGCSADDTAVMVSFFEMYGGNIQDLLNKRERLKILEDGKGEINVTGLTESVATSPERLLQILQAGNVERTTHMTEANDTSSRSHAICQIMLRDRSSDKLRGKLSLVDLAGSERGTDTKSHNAQRRGESAEINTSLLALKECIRALDSNKNGEKHVPYRSSKLTLILKDCFTSDCAMTTMIATISPGASAADHSVNTLRYADRAKDKGSKKSPVRVQSPARRNVSAGGVASVASKKPELTASGSSTAVKATTPPRCNPGKPSSAAEQESRQSLHNSTTVVKDEDQESRRSRQFNTAHVDDKDQVFSRPRPKGPALAEGEDAFLIMHMSNIQENAELLTKEGALLAQVQRPGRTADDIDRYATALEEILEQKEDMILDLRRMDVFKEHLLHREKLGPSK